MVERLLVDRLLFPARELWAFAPLERARELAEPLAEREFERLVFVSVILDLLLPVPFPQVATQDARASTAALRPYCWDFA